MASKRMLAKNICTSNKIDKLTWFQEVLYYRILVNADDHGCFYFSEATIKEMCFPGKQVSLKTIYQGRNALCLLDLVAVIFHDNRKFLAIKGWEKFQKFRPDRQKYSLFGMTSGMTEDLSSRQALDLRVKSLRVKSLRVKSLSSADAPGEEPNDYFKFLKAFGEIYEAKTGCKYRKTGKDWKLVKEMVDQSSLDAVIEKAKLLFELCSNGGGPWFAKSMADFTIGNLSANWNKIIQEVKHGKQVGVSKSEIEEFVAGRKQV